MIQATLHMTGSSDTSIALNSTNPSHVGENFHACESNLLKVRNEAGKLTNGQSSESSKSHAEENSMSRDYWESGMRERGFPQIFSGLMKTKRRPTDAPPQLAQT